MQIMTTNILHIAVAQLKPTLGDIAGNLDKARAARATARGQGADLVLFTELFVSGGAEHQGPDGGGPIAVIVKTDTTSSN